MHRTKGWLESTTWAMEILPDWLDLLEPDTRRTTP